MADGNSKMDFSDLVINLSFRQFVQNGLYNNVMSYEKWQSVMLLNKLIPIRGTVLSNCKDIKIRRQLYIYIVREYLSTDSIDRMMQLFSIISLIAW